MHFTFLEILRPDQLGNQSAHVHSRVTSFNSSYVTHFNIARNENESYSQEPQLTLDSCVKGKKEKPRDFQDYNRRLLQNMDRIFIANLVTTTNAMQYCRGKVFHMCYYTDF